MQEFVEETGEQGVMGLQNLHNTLATAGKTLLPYHLRPLRKLLTPASRHAIVPTLLAAGATPQDLLEKVKEIAAAMWLEWVWRPENPHIHPDNRMHPSPAVASCRRMPRGK